MLCMAFAVIEDDTQRDGLADFYSKYKIRLYSIAYSKVHNKQEAEDAVQETFNRIADKPDRFFGIPREKRISYADVITKNIACDMFKRNQKADPSSDDGRVSEVHADVSFADIVVEEENACEMINFINSLPERKKAVLLLKINQKMSTAEIAADLKISEDAVRKRLSDAKKLIKDYLERRRNDG